MVFADPCPGTPSGKMFGLSKNMTKCTFCNQEIGKKWDETVKFKRKVFLFYVPVPLPIRKAHFWNFV